MNVILTSIPYDEEIKVDVFGLNKHSAPRLYGFGGVFLQTYWNISHVDVCNSIWKNFKTWWMLPNYNANIIILLPKTSDVDTMSNFKPIALANFNFKIISKIIVDRLSKMMPFMVSEEPKGFIHGRNIKECLCLASEVANLLYKKTNGGNVALKVDITKAFDIINWDFS